MKRTAFLLAFIFLLQPFLHAQSGSVADFVNGYIKRHQVPGVAVMVRQNGKVVLSEGYGLANLEHKVPVTAQTIFQSGSMGKQFTATAVMMLVEENKIALTDPISKYLVVPDTWSGITIRHLLTHTSGLGDYPEAVDFRKDYTEEEIFKVITEQPLQFAPGAKWSYSNLGYVTLGILIHKVSGKFYGDYLKERVFDPLGMKSTRIISEADIIPNRAAGYEMKDGVLKNQEWVAPMINTTADGSLYFNVTDLALWDESLENEKLLKHESYQEMYTPVKLNDASTAPYGFGWSIEKTASGRPLIEHGGAWQGFTSHIARYPNDHVSVATLCNVAGADCGYIAHRIAGLYKAELALPTHNAIRLDPSVLKAYEGSYKSGDRVFKVTIAGESLIGTFGGPKHMLLPESPTTFFEEDSERTFRFDKDAKGRITRIMILPDEVELPRVP